MPAKNPESRARGRGSPLQLSARPSQSPLTPGITTDGSRSLWAGGWFPPVMVNREVKAGFSELGKIGVSLPVGDPHYRTQRFMEGLSFPSKRFYLGTGPASASFVDICLVIAGMCVSTFEDFVSRGDQKWLAPLISPGTQEAKWVKREQGEHQL